MERVRWHKISSSALQLCGSTAAAGFLVTEELAASPSTVIVLLRVVEAGTVAGTEW